MNIPAEEQMPLLLAGTVSGLCMASATGFALSRRLASPVIENLNARIRSWWSMIAVFAFTLFIGPAASMLLFAAISFLALREYTSLIDTARADHRTLFWSFFVFIPVQYLAWYSGRHALAALFIPVGALVFVPVRSALAADTRDFLQRVAAIAFGLMLCVFCLSHASALLTLQIRGYQNQNAKLLLFLVVVTQVSDVFQYIWGKLLGKRKLAPHLSPNKTWEGLIGGILTAVALGTWLWPITPFNRMQAFFMAFVIALMGFAGGLVMSGIKRDRGRKDFGTSIRGHGGVLDRVDSLCFSAPVFFYLTRWMVG